MVKVKQEPTPQAKKRVKQSVNGLGKRIKTMQVSSYESSEDDDEDKPIEQDAQEARTTISKKAGKPKVENMNMQIINDDKFVQLNKFYSMYNNIDRR